MKNDEFFQDMAKLEEQQTLQKQQAFHQLARDIVNGKKGITPAIALDILTAAGKTRDDLEQAQREYSSRVDAAKLIAQEKTITAELQLIGTSIENEDKRLRAAIDAHHAAAIPLVEKREQLAEQVKTIESAKKLLRGGCTAPILLAEESAINDRSNELMDEFRALKITISGAEGAKDRIAYIDAIRGDKTPEEIAERANCVEMVKASPDVEKQMKKNRQEYSETLPKRLSALHARMLAP